MVHLAAKHSLIIQLGIETPGEHGPHLHGAIACCLLLMTEVVKWVTALDPAWKLPAHHSLRNHLRGGFRLWLNPFPLPILKSIGSILAQLSCFALMFLQGLGLSQFGVVNLSCAKHLRAPEPCYVLAVGLCRNQFFALVFHWAGGLGGWNHIDELAIPLEVHLRERNQLAGEMNSNLYIQEVYQIGLDKQTKDICGDGTAVLDDVNRANPPQRQLVKALWRAPAHHWCWLRPCDNANQGEVLGLVATERCWTVGSHHRDGLWWHCGEK